MGSKLDEIIFKFDELYKLVDSIKIKYLNKNNEIVNDMNNIKVNMMIIGQDLKDFKYDFDNN